MPELSSSSSLIGVVNQTRSHFVFCPCQKSLDFNQAGGSIHTYTCTCICFCCLLGSVARRHNIQIFFYVLSIGQRSKTPKREREKERKREREKERKREREREREKERKREREKGRARERERGERERKRGEE